MREPDRMALSGEPTVGLQSHALATLEYIRASIDSASSYAVPGLTGIVMGGIGLAAAVVASFATTFLQMVAIWLCAAFVAGACGSAIMIGKEGRVAIRAYRVTARKFALCLIPTLSAGAVLSAVLWFNGAERLLPGTWLLLYGAAVLSTSTVTVRSVAAMGGMFTMLGVFTFFAPAAWANVLLGLGFGALHLGFGLHLTLARRQELRRGN